MDVRIMPGALSGPVTPPPSKSMAHRLLISAALTGGVSTLHGLADSQDIQATRRCLSALGAYIEDLSPGTVQVRGLGNAIVEAGPAPILDCGESGSTLRFLIPLALLVNGKAAFIGHGRLMERPLTPYEDLSRKRASPGSWKTASWTWTAARDMRTTPSPPANTAFRGTCPASSSPGCCSSCPCCGAKAPR